MQHAIVNFSRIAKPSFRLEAEFYNSSSLLNADSFSGDEVIDFVQYGTSKELNEERRGFPTLRLNEFDSFYVKFPQKYCDKIDIDTFYSLTLNRGDVLICRTNGNPKLVGKSAIVPMDYNYAFASYLYRIRPNKSKILSTVLVSFLNSALGRAEIEKHLMVSNQANFSPAKLGEIRIPRLQWDLQERIDRVIWDSFDCHNGSQMAYTQAQDLLLTELGLVDWHPKHSLTFSKKHSDTRHAERIDADYFQPKYAEIEGFIKSYSGGWDSLSNLVQTHDSKINPKEEIKYSYIELANIGIHGEVTDCMIAEGRNLPSRARRQVALGDVIVSSIEGSIDRIALICKQFDHALCSTGFHVLKSKSINPETLLVLMKSLIGQYQLRKGCAGSILSAISKNRLDSLYLPRIRDDIQVQIKQKIIESFNLRDRSKHLLECAKRSVEIAIEQNEQTAIEWLSKNSNEG